MKKGLIIVALLFLINSMFLVVVEAQQNQSKGGVNITPIIPPEEICCKIYGLGKGMKEVNVRYRFMAEEDCSVPEDFVGGGRKVVSVDRCVKQIRALTKEQVRVIRMERNRLRLNGTFCPAKCLCPGSTIKCEMDGGRNMTVIAGKSGNIIVQMKQTNVSTRVQLYRAESDRKFYGVFRNNETRAINILPDEVQEKIRDRIKARLENQTIELDEDGIYQTQARKRARLFLMFPVKERVRIQIDSETGDIIKTKTSWWGFLARDVKE